MEAKIIENMKFALEKGNTNRKLYTKADIVMAYQKVENMDGKTCYFNNEKYMEDTLNAILEDNKYSIYKADKNIPRIAIWI